MDHRSRGTSLDTGRPVGDAMEITLPDQIKLYFDKAGLGNPTFLFLHGGGADTSNYLFCTLKTAAAAIATCLVFPAFVRNSLSAKQWAQVISPRWKYQSRSIV